MGIHVDGKVEGFYVGSALADAVYVGAEKVWPTKIMMETDFSYGVASNTRLSDASTDWVDHPDGNARMIKTESAGVPVARPFGGGSGTLWPAAMWAHPMPTTDLAVTITLHNNLHYNLPTGIVIGGIGTGDRYLRLDLSGQEKFFTVGTGVTTGRVRYAITSLVGDIGAGDIITLQRLSEGANWRCNVLVNGEQKYTNAFSKGTLTPGVEHNVGGIHAHWSDYRSGAPISHFRIETLP